MMTTPNGTPIAIPTIEARRALYGAAAFLRDEGLIGVPVDILYEALQLTGAGAAVRGRALAALRLLLLGSSEPGALGEAIRELSNEGIAEACERAAKLVG
jgi:hypothetical protein